MQLIWTDIQLIILVTILQIKSDAEIEAKVFNSIAALQPLVETQSKVIRSIEAYLSAERKKIDYIKEHINYSKQKLREAKNDSKYYWDPFEAFSAMNRVDRGFTFIMNLTKDRTGYYKDNRLVYPCREDLIGAAEGIVRLQTTYGLSIKQLANGTLVSNFSQSNAIFVENVTPMTADDCLALGLVNYTLQGFTGQLLWMKQALKKYYQEKCLICTLGEEEIVRHIGEAYYNLRENEQALKWGKRYIALKPAHKRNIEDDNFLRDLQAKVDNDLKTKRHKTNTGPQNSWKQPRLRHLFGCYEDLKPKASFRDHQCRLTAKSAYMMYQPVKTEVLSLSPYVGLFHDVISDSEINALLESAQPNLMTDAGVYDLVGGKPKINRNNQYLVAKSIFLDRTNPLAVKLNQRMADIVGCHRRSSVSLQVSNYGIGGFYGQHVDYFGYIMDTPHADREGDRLFAYVYFLSNVEQGGALVFPDLGLKYRGVVPEERICDSLGHPVPLRRRTGHCVSHCLSRDPWIQVDCSKLGQASGQGSVPCVAHVQWTYDWQEVQVVEKRK
ncbi:hypothetical protein NE865_04541 [Phthorimaea operculella]|nr:hypothetical protein NE865_04541 [Phthorimaea operculella]